MFTVNLPIDLKNWLQSHQYDCARGWMDSYIILLVILSHSWISLISPNMPRTHIAETIVRRLLTVLNPFLRSQVEPIPLLPHAKAIRVIAAHLAFCAFGCSAWTIRDTRLYLFAPWGTTLHLATRGAAQQGLHLAHAVHAVAATVRLKYSGFEKKKLIGWHSEKRSLNAYAVRKKPYFKVIITGYVYAPLA
jgi:hypothetical protein